MTLPSTEIAATFEGFRRGDDGPTRIVAGWVVSVVRTGRWGFADPDGIAQEILITLLKIVRADRIEDPESFLKFVRTVAKRECVDAYYRQRRRDRVEQPAPEEFDAPDPASKPTAALEGREKIAALTYLAQRMSEDCRQLWQWIYVEKRTAEAVAAQLNLTAGNVRVRAHRCLEKAREIVAHFAETTPGLVRG